MVETFLRVISKILNNFMQRKEMKKIVVMFLTAWVFSMIPILASAQNAKFKLADKYYQSFDYTSSGNIYKDIISDAKYAKDTLALRRLARGEAALGKYVESEGYLNRLVKENSVTENDLVMLADIQKKQSRYGDALKTYEMLLQRFPANDIAKRYLEDPEFAEKIRQDSVIYSIRNSAVNTSYSEFGVGFFTDKKMIFSSSRNSGNKNARIYNLTEQPYLNVYFANVAHDSSLKDIGEIDGKFNSRYHEGTMAYIPSEGMVYFTRNNYLNGKIQKSKTSRLNLGIYTIKYNISDESWGELKEFPYNNPQYSVGHPALNTSKNKLYFVSDMPGGYGGTDIYYCDKTGDSWGEPKNAGPKINTSGNEMFPFMVSDSLMYFSSDGHVGLGGLDIFLTNPLDDSPVVNAGYPVSTKSDDFSFICYSDELYGYFSSNRPGGKGGDDIYEFKVIPVDSVEISGVAMDMETLKPIPGVVIKVPAEDGSVIEVETDQQGRYSVKAPFRPELTIEGQKQGYLPASGVGKPNPRSSRLGNIDIKMKKFDAISSGKVLYAENNAPAVGALVRLIEIADGDSIEVDSAVITQSGKYEFPLYTKKNYMVQVTQEGYARQTSSFNTRNPSEKNFVRDFKLFKPKVGEVVRLDNIYYDYNSDKIRPDAALELNKLVQILNDNPTMKIELSSHTDSRGSDSYNLKLSDKRAKSAVDYIISQGISADRLYGKGYGELKILNHCTNDVKCSEEEHQYNRRTEFTITGF